MKKKILVVSTALRIGGVERSLIGLLNALDRERHEVSLFLYAHEGEFMPMIPDGVRLLAEMPAYAALERPIRSVLGSRVPGIALARLAAKTVTSLRAVMGIRGFLLPRSIRYALPFLPDIPGKYDLALSFLTPHDPVLRKVRSRRKVGWIHTDYSTMETGVDTALETPMWAGLDAIAAVSDDVSKTFVQVFPSVKDKVFVCENILSPAFVRAQAAEGDVSTEMPVEPGVLRLCSVGRFCHQKGFDEAVLACRRLLDAGIRVRWYVIGYGPDEALLRGLIAEQRVEKEFILLGKRTNPYPYMKACDIYVQPSRYEGKAVTVREAQMLGCPVVITRFPTAGSQLEDGVDGHITSAGVEGIADGIRRLAEDAAFCRRLAQTAASRDYGNASEAGKILQLCEGKELQ